ncbi:methyltransferase domain-containing protein [Halobacillus yeomjeoni]|uniref:class I SAM-dependent methyltransferase n=1 Tax=Halobacillus yeomjeoni TaxID=311194 RepID=UPI001CD7E61E|nr:class I SAM-dependent methyltransferase [Halobacillus yeomjeoni]MCA0984467.1 methyltransferase domain-containing protein [Halobacillus yeomjeoni]
MVLQRVLPYSHSLMEQALSEGDIAIDATCGNGHDTLFLTNQVGENGHVYGFDIQQEAVDNTRQRLRDNDMESRATLFHESHSHVKECIPEKHHSQIKAAIYNLGYLPGSDKSIVTTPKETIESVEKILSMIQKGGILVLVVYHGHPGGKEEKNALLEYVSNLDQKYFKALQYGFINQKNDPPFIVAIEKQ